MSEVILGSMLSREPEYGANYPASDWNSVDPRYLRITDIDDSGRLIPTDAKCIPRQVAEPYLLEDDDLVVARTGNTVGKSYLHSSQNGRMAFAGYLVRFRFDEKKACPRFVFQYLHSPFFWGWVNRTLRTGAQPNINASEYKTLPIPVFRTREQKQIARILTTLDNLIEKTEALIAKYQSIKQGMMHDLFTRGVDSNGQLRPTHEQAPDLYKPSDLGFIPKEWEAKRLGEKLKEVDGRLQTGPFGSQLHSYEYVTEGVPVIMPQQINNGVVDSETIARITPRKALQMRRHWVDVNDIVFSRRGELCRSAAIGKRESGWVCGTGCFLLRVSKYAIDAAWLSHLYRHAFIQRQVDANAVGSTMPSLNNSVMERLKFTFPPVCEQREIARRISAIDSSIRMEEERRNKARLTKSGLMQDLLTGKVRVKVDEAKEVAANA